MIRIAKAKAVKTLVFCTGKFYYDLLEEKEKLEREDVALVRIEQLFPLPVADDGCYNQKMDKAECRTLCLGTRRTT